LELKFPVTPEFNQPRVTIQPDGFIPVIGLADLHVEGLTLDELVTALRKAYSSTLKDPEISVTLVDFEKPYFVVGGEVSKPGKYDMRGATTVAQAVTIAGGFSKAAKRSKVLLFRNISDEWVKVVKLDLGKMFNTADLTEDLQLNPGDMVYVSQSGFAKVREYLPRTDALIWWAIRGW
jgi:polysaccharide biosynthesis/export protein